MGSQPPRGWESGPVDIARHIFDVREAAQDRLLARMIEKNSVRVETHDSPGRANAHAEEIRYAARTAPQIEAAPSRPHTRTETSCTRSRLFAAFFSRRSREDASTIRQRYFLRIRQTRVVFGQVALDRHLIAGLKRICRHPKWRRMSGGPSSIFQLTTSPLSFFTST